MYRCNKGFSLIEVLVAVVILSFGLISIAALQINSKAVSYDSIQRTAAAQLAQDIIGKMRSNPTGAANYLGTYNGPDGGAAPTCVSPCTETEVAAIDIYNWREALNSATGGVESPIACITTLASTNYYNISITWQGTSSIAHTVARCGDTGNAAVDNYRRIISLDVLVTSSGLGI